MKDIKEISLKVLPRCSRCGREYSLERRKLGYSLCLECSRKVVSPYREVSVAATSLDWF